MTAPLFSQASAGRGESVPLERRLVVTISALTRSPRGVRRGGCLQAVSLGVEVDALWQVPWIRALRAERVVARMATAHSVPSAGIAGLTMNRGDAAEHAAEGS